jgi:hypothetical protein
MVKIKKVSFVVKGAVEKFHPRTELLDGAQKIRDVGIT